MKNPRKAVTVTLMISSMALLVVLQILWLRSAYEKSFMDLRRESNTQLRGTVWAMRDSIMLHNIEPIESDSALEALERADFRSDSPSLKIARIENEFRARKGKKEQAVRVIISSVDSTKKDVLKPLASRLQYVKMFGKDEPNSTFIIRISPDTLDPVALDSSFRVALRDNGIDLPFTIKTTRSIAEDPEDVIPFAPRIKMRKDFLLQQKKSNENYFTNAFTTEAVRINPVVEYAASISGIRTFVLKKITPQILFSAFLTLITAAAFSFMYINIRNQERLVETKNDFINNVSHELKTPVATVSVALEAMKNFNALENPALTKEYLNMALRELQRLSSMTDNILETSVLEEKAAISLWAEVDLKDIVEDVLQSFHLILKNNEVSLSKSYSGNNFQVNGVPTQLTHMLYNLLDNAIKYRKSENASINISLADTGDVVQLIVEDNGVGIEKGYQNKIFEKFFRVPSGDIHNVKGYGLGLSYVKNVVHQHKGTVNVESAVGSGSKFTITIPKK